ncbi:hypothetical protein T03_10932 [Trichinella britovi]|uniref:Uncharacterized protein n=1 Tax=Trichinella britovi TaxID=45882 RepID=A0A0V1C2T2_TRIBR|nr:hypothetical protein T03_10932 [Trichinella britovi]
MTLSIVYVWWTLLQMNSRCSFKLNSPFIQHLLGSLG